MESKLSGLACAFQIVGNQTFRCILYTAFVPKEVVIKMNLLLYRIFNEQIDLKESSCFILISS